MFCIKCGEQLPDDAKFCFKCGNSTNKEIEKKQPYLEDVKGIQINERNKSEKNIFQFQERKPNNIKALSSRKIYFSSLVAILVILGLILLSFLLRQEPSPHQTGKVKEIDTLKLFQSSDEVAESILVVWHDSLWVDKKGKPDEVIIVPTFTFKIKNTGSQALQDINFNCIFSFADSGENLTDDFVVGVKKPLSPGQVSDVIFVKGFYGYSASSKKAFIKNIANWKNIMVKVYVKTMYAGNALVGIFPIKKKIKGISE